MNAESLDPGSDRNATLRLVDWFDLERVQNAHVLVVGAGALGNEVLKNLALFGVGHIYIFDRDRVELANLSRSVLFRADDNGQPKAEVAARAIKKLNPNIEVHYRLGDIRFSLGEGLIRRMDVVIGCLDSMGARYTLNRLCYRVGVPWVDGGIASLHGQVQVFLPPDGACYECGFSEKHYEEAGIRANCAPIAVREIELGRVPTTATIASLIAAVQVQEALKLLDFGRWADRSLGGKVFRYHGDQVATDRMELAPNPSCPAHDPFDLRTMVTLPGISYRDSARALLEAVGPYFDGEAVLYFEDEIVVTGKCECGETLDVRQSLRRLRADPPQCGACQKALLWESALQMTRYSSPILHPGVLDRSLRELGIGPLGIVLACAVNQEMYFELGADWPGCVSPFDVGQEPAELR
ncbi:MAG: HesA/MoeB/ThiF family protein [Bryobacterales bacterium]|nr:HesA/MoeB/ThiF family protein [Bryobacterales bacterium]